MGTATATSAFPTATFGGNITGTTSPVKIYPSTDSTTAVQVLKADGTTNVLNVDTTNGRVGIGTPSPQQILELSGDTPRILLTNTAASGKSLEFFAGTSGVGIGTTTAQTQIIIATTAPNSALTVDASYLTLGVAFGITSDSTHNIALRPGAGVAGKSVNIDAYNGTAWQTVLAAPNVASGNANLTLCGNNGVVAVAGTTASTSTTTGALTVAGGVGVAGALYAASLTSTGQTTTTSANGEQWIRGEATELLTLSTAGTTTDTTANLLPANSVIKSVVARVTTTITTATDWKLGDATTAGRFTAADATMTAGETQVGLVHVDQTGAAGPKQTAAAKVRVTTTGTPGAGVIRITVYYEQFVAPTS